jgi:HSP20 family molecular chaperone IbpA
VTKQNYTMSGPEISSTLQSTDHDFIAGLRFLDEFAKHLSSRRSSYASEDLRHHLVPRFDLEEHEQSYELYGELPGFGKDHIVIEANDDRNIQISGWIPRRHHDSSGLSADATPGTDATDPFVKVQHHDVPAGPHQPTMERFGEVLNPHHEPLPASSDSPVTSHSLATPDPSTAADPPKPAHEAKPETARFGDALNPHAAFVHRPKDGAKEKPKVRYLVAERRFGQFHRVFHFPSPIKKDEVQARMHNGILHVTAPKAAVPPPMKIEIKHGGSS